MLVENTNTVTLEAVDFFSPEPDECLIQVPPVSVSGGMNRDAQFMVMRLILLSSPGVNGRVPGLVARPSSFSVRVDVDRSRTATYSVVIVVFCRITGSAYQAQHNP